VVPGTTFGLQLVTSLQLELASFVQLPFAARVFPGSKQTKPAINKAAGHRPDTETARWYFVRVSKKVPEGCFIAWFDGRGEAFKVGRALIFHSLAEENDMDFAFADNLTITDGDDDFLRS
jgi:hypothetical protein